MTDLDEMTLRGAQPIKAAIRMLKTYEESEDIGGITIKFEPSEDRRQTQYDEFQLEQKENETNAKVANNSSEFVDNGSDEDINRTEGTIKPGTSHHWVLYLLDELGGEDRYVPGARVKDEAVNTPASDSSIYPALTNLYERMITERTQRAGSYSYRLTEHGMNVLDELGKPSDNKDKED